MTHRPVQVGARYRFVGSALNPDTGVTEPLVGRAIFANLVQDELDLRIEGELVTFDGVDGDYVIDVMPSTSALLVPNVPAILRVFSQGESSDDITGLGVFALSPK